MQIIGHKKFILAALDLTKKALIVYMAYPSAKILIYLARNAQIDLLIVQKVIVPDNSLDFIDIFLKKAAAKLPKRFDINDHIINLESGKQPLYRPIYSLRPIKLKTEKTYIKINLANNFICPLKSLARAFILYS